MSSKSETAEIETTGQTGPAPHYDLVVVGSSAGGVEALSRLVATLPTTFPAPIVIAQHLDPARPSHLGAILERRSNLPVRTVGDREPLLPGVVYVVPADRDIEVTDHHVRLLSDAARHSKPSVNLLFSSAARMHGERLIAVILTGTGSDGAAGAREVKAAGGMVVIENPETASYPGMPLALAPTTVDVVADLERIGPLLFELLTGAYTPVQATTTGETEDSSLTAFLEQLRDRSGIDFAQYKTPTILRRLQRRMAATGTGSLDEYRRYLASHPEEDTRLIASFLIKVTEFFRDPQLFDLLRSQVLPELIAHARSQLRQAENHNSPALRFWSAGCATGEEAYSLAILLADLLGADLEAFNVRIFATDLDPDAIAFARRGIYPATALKGLSAELLARYFTRTDDGYEVSKRVRGLVVFGQHDLGQRAPFPHIDLVLCRNVLIYFTPELQRRALHLFAFALREGGYLVLGKAETSGALADLFTPVGQARLKVFRRHGERTLIPPVRHKGLLSLTPRSGPPPGQVAPGELLSRRGAPRKVRAAASSASGKETAMSDTTAEPAPDGQRAGNVLDPLRPGAGPPRMQTASEKLGSLVLELPIGVVVVDRQYDVETINAAAHRLLGIFRSAVGKDLIHLAANVPSGPLRAAIDAAFRAVSPPVADPAVLDTVITVQTAQGDQRDLRIACYPRWVAAGPGTGSQRDRTATAGVEPDAPPGAEARPRAQQSTAERVVLLISDVTEAEQQRRAALEAAVREQRGREDAAAREARDRTQAQSRTQQDQEQAQRRQQEQIERLTRQLDSVGAINRDLLEANQELTAAVLDLRAVNEDLLVSHEEVQASAEEIKTLNEELQASNEELETLNEEMEATNEELQTTNEDLQARSLELQRLAATLEEQRGASDAERARLAAILLSMADAVLVVDASGAPVLTNAAYAAMFGGANAILAPEDEQGRLLPPEATPQRRATGGEPFSMVFYLPAADGTRREFEANGQPIRDIGADGSTDGKAAARGDIVGGVVTIRDVTERSLHRLQDQFVTLASHELRSPLTSQLTALQLLTKRVARQRAAGPGEARDEHASGDASSGASDAETIASLATVEAAFAIDDNWRLLGMALYDGLLLKALVNDLTDVERLKHGKLALYRERLDLKALVREVVDRMRRQAQGHTLHVAVAGADAEPLWVAGDALRLEQVLRNLLTNACKYAPASERVDVRLRRVDGAAGAAAELQVEDYGPGIAAAALPSLFTRFYQVTRPDSLRHTGLGLGLFICRQLIEAHDGTITVTSEEGKGTCFTVRLPVLERMGGGEKG
jgi:two-component system CheB/CheR fusion protein